MELLVKICSKYMAEVVFVMLYETVKSPVRMFVINYLCASNTTFHQSVRF